jgi:hypothetical protein
MLPRVALTPVPSPAERERGIGQVATDGGVWANGMSAISPLLPGNLMGPPGSGRRV